MESPVIERRFDARFEPPALAGARATLRPGCAVILVDVSAAGALVEAPRPLRPGARVHLQVTTLWRRFGIGAHVLRCAVWALDPLDGVTYRGALRFAERVEWSWATPTRRVQRLPEHVGPTRTADGKPLPQNEAAQASINRD